MVNSRLIINSYKKGKKRSLTGVYREILISANSSSRCLDPCSININAFLSLFELSLKLDEIVCREWFFFILWSKNMYIMVLFWMKNINVSINPRHHWSRFVSGEQIGDSWLVGRMLSDNNSLSLIHVHVCCRSTLFFFICSS